VASLAGHSTREVVEYGEQVFGKLCWGTTHSCIENQEFAAVSLNKEAEEVESEPGKPIPMGNHKLELVSAQKSFQYGLQTFSFEVESGRDVFDDFRLGVDAVHSLDLPFKIISLLVRTNAAIADDDRPFGNAQPSIDIEESLSCRVPY